MPTGMAALSVVVGQHMVGKYKTVVALERQLDDYRWLYIQSLLREYRTSPHFDDSGVHLHTNEVCGSTFDTSREHFDAWWDEEQSLYCEDDGLREKAWWCYTEEGTHIDHTTEEEMAAYSAACEESLSEEELAELKEPLAMDLSL